jgi:hypothetical protein
MASELEFTDTIGTEILTNGYPAPGDRFSAWKTDAPVEGPEAEELGSGTLHKYEFHTKYVASFELRDIPQDQWEVADRLVRHLNRAGTVTVYTGDVADRTYTCQKLKGTNPELGPPDRYTLRRNLKLTLRNTEAAVMLCIWP